MLLPVGKETLTPSTTVPLYATKPCIRFEKQQNFWMIYVEGADIRWDDSAPPPAEQQLVLSSSVGIRLADGHILEYDGDFKNWRCIAVSGTPTVYIYKYVREI